MASHSPLFDSTNKKVVPFALSEHNGLMLSQEFVFTGRFQSEIQMMDTVMAHAYQDDGAALSMVGESRPALRLLGPNASVRGLLAHGDGSLWLSVSDESDDGRWTFFVFRPTSSAE